MKSILNREQLALAMTLLSHFPPSSKKSMLDAQAYMGLLRFMPDAKRVHKLVTNFTKVVDGRDLSRLTSAPVILRTVVEGLSSLMQVANIKKPAKKRTIVRGAKAPALVKLPTIDVFPFEGRAEKYPKMLQRRV